MNKPTLEEKVKRVNKLLEKNKWTEEEVQRETENLNRIAREPKHQENMINFLKKIGQIKD